VQSIQRVRRRGPGRRTRRARRRTDDRRRTDVMTMGVDDDVLDWLLEPKNPTARWLTLRLLLDRADDDPDVLEAQQAIPDSRRTQAVLAGQRSDGSWARGKT